MDSKPTRPRIVGLFLRWHRREWGWWKRALLIAAGIVVFLGLVPLALVAVGRWLGRVCGIGSFGLPLLRFIGWALAALGLALVVWTVRYQFVDGGGTPAPLVPTRRLLTTGPYSLCRNPMNQGLFLYYLGIALGCDSPAAMLLALGAGAVMICYLKLVEEKELEARFGESYREYRQRTPFFWPRLRRR